jgi:hypothetical protein
VHAQHQAATRNLCFASCSSQQRRAKARPALWTRPSETLFCCRAPQREHAVTKGRTARQRCGRWQWVLAGMPPTSRPTGGRTWPKACVSVAYGHKRRAGLWRSPGAMGPQQSETVRAQAWAASSDEVLIPPPPPRGTSCRFRAKCWCVVACFR